MVASLGALRERVESSWGHVLVFDTVPSANTLVRWVDEKRLRPHSAGSTLPHLWPTGSSRGGPHRLRPGTSPHALRIPPHGGHPALRVTRGGCRSPLAVSGFRLRARVGFAIPSPPRPARHYPRFWIRRPSSGRRRDLNPPDHHAAQRTLLRLRRPRCFSSRLLGTSVSRVPRTFMTEDSAGSFRRWLLQQPLPLSAAPERHRGSSVDPVEPFGTGLSRTGLSSRSDMIPLNRLARCPSLFGFH